MSDNGPIFIVGTGRCGSTMFHDVLSLHPALGWLSQYVHKYPRRPALNARLVGLARRALVGKIMNKHLYPAEPYRFWEAYCPGFSTPFRDLLASDLTPKSARAMRRAVELANPKGRRFLAKITGWPRIGLLGEAFPDARFVHVIRDGRAVVNSSIAAPYFEGWSGPSNWTRGELSEEQSARWEASGWSFVVLAAIGWENRMRAFRTAGDRIGPDRYTEIHYEAFCDRPEAVLGQVMAFTGLPEADTPAFFEAVSRMSFRSQNDKWRHDLTPAQQQHLDDYLSPLLTELGYEAGPATAGPDAV